MILITSSFVSAAHEGESAEAINSLASFIHAVRLSVHFRTEDKNRRDEREKSFDVDVVRIMTSMRAGCQCEIISVF